MYRAVTLAGIRRGVDWDRPEQLAQLVKQLEIKLAGQRVLLDGDDVTEAIRSSEVTAASRFAADNRVVRERLVEIQRQAASDGDLVTEGRDQGTVVFPNARCKIYLTASPRERARRRLGDLEAQGEPKPLDELIEEITSRDQRDVSRDIGPLVAAPDALTVWTDEMSRDQVVDYIESVVRRCREEPAQNQ
jgi:cytidylate kinase